MGFRTGNLYQKDKTIRNEIPYVEPLTKSRARGLHHHARAIDAILYEVGGDRCPFAIFEFYKSHRPPSMRNEGFLYLQSLIRIVGDVWYTDKRRDGVNYIGNFMQRMKSKCSLAETSGDKKMTGHSSRKTVVRKL